MADWDEARRRLETLRNPGLLQSERFELGLEVVRWMSQPKNQHLDMFEFINMAAGIALSKDPENY